jgi:hypothetical protein
MRQYQCKQLPTGIWLQFNGLPPGMTDAEFQGFLTQRGLHIPLENINVRQGKTDDRITGSGRHSQKIGCDSSAKISVPREVVIALLTWAINGEKLRDHDVIVAW